MRAQVPSTGTAPRSRQSQGIAAETRTGVEAVIRARPYRDGDEAAVLGVLQLAFGHWPLDIEGVDPSEFFRWKHLENPFGPSLLSVVEADGEVIGFAAGLQWRVRVGDRVLKAMRGCDVGVHPDFRGRSLAVELIQETQRRFPSDLAVGFTSPNQQSLSGMRRAGRRRAGDLRVFVRPTRPLRSTLRRAFGRPAPAGEITLQAETVAEALADSEQVTGLLERTPVRGDAVTTARDLSYLRWRYGTLPGYRAARIEAGGRLGGLAIFRVRSRGSATVTRICELLVADGDAEVRRRLLRAVRRAAPTDFVSAAFASRRAALRHGFVPAPRGRMLMVNPLRPDLLPEDPTRRESWTLSLGDLEII